MNLWHFHSSHHRFQSSLLDAFWWFWHFFHRSICLPRQLSARFYFMIVQNAVKRELMSICELENYFPFCMCLHLIKKIKAKHFAFYAKLNLSLDSRIRIAEKNLVCFAARFLFKIKIWVSRAEIKRLNMRKERKTFHKWKNFVDFVRNARISLCRLSFSS